MNEEDKSGLVKLIGEAPVGDSMMHILNDMIDHIQELEKQHNKLVLKTMTDAELAYLLMSSIKFQHELQMELKRRQSGKENNNES